MKWHQPWMDDALCAEIGPADALFFPEARGQTREAKQAKETCRRCPVVEQCLQYALANPHEQGIWGGMSENERRQYRRWSA